MYLSKPSPNDECYYEENSYAVNKHTRGFRPSTQGSNQEKWHKRQGNQGRIYGNYNHEGHYFQDGSYNRDKTSTGVTLVTEMIGMVPLSLLKIM